MSDSQTSSIRESLNAAVEKVEKETTHAPTVEAGADALPERADPAPGAESAPVDGDVGPERSGAGERVRDPATGKFVAKPKDSATGAPKVEAEAKTPAPVASPPALSQPPAPVTTTPTLKAPQSWKADIREKFATLPPEVQAEVLRRETEVQQAMQGSAPAKRVYEAIAPFEADFKAMGADVAQALPGILSTVKALAKGDVQTKARILGQMVTSYLGKDEAGLKALASAIDMPEQAAAVDPAAIEQRIWAQMQQRQENAAIQQALQDFGAEPREFLEDVMPDFQAFVQAARARGEPPSAKLLEDAYRKACRVNESVSAVLAQREAAKAAQAAQASAQAKANASVSAKTSPAPVAPTAPKGIRAALEEAAAKHSAGR